MAGDRIIEAIYTYLDLFSHMAFRQSSPRSTIAFEQCWLRFHRGELPAAVRKAATVIVGAGIIGLAAAYYMRRNGDDVVVLDRGPAGMATSHGNGGWICPAHATPLPAPGTFGFALRSAFNPRAPLYLKPRWDWDTALWMLRFMKRCNLTDYEQGLAALAALSQPTMDLMDELVNDGLQFEMHRTGLLHAYLDYHSAVGALERQQEMAKFGYTIPTEVVAGREVHEIEPALSDRVAAIYVVDQERHVNPDTLSGAFVARLRDMGVEVREGEEVLDFKGSADKIHEVRTTTRVLEASSVLVAAGIWTRRLVARLGRKIPLQAGKGYSFSLVPKIVPRRALHLGQSSVAATPISGRVRIGGTMEFSGENLLVDTRRIHPMLDAARVYLGDFAEADSGVDLPSSEVWVGMRSITPDGLPIIDRLAPYQNVYISCGHAMLGMSLAVASGRVLADFLATGKRSAVLDAFAAERF